MIALEVRSHLRSAHKCHLTISPVAQQTYTTTIAQNGTPMGLFMDTLWVQVPASTTPTSRYRAGFSGGFGRGCRADSTKEL
jgi:hypothetical protein